MNHRERMLAALAGEETDRPAVFSANQTATYSQMDELGAEWPEAHQEAEPMATLAAGAYSILGFDAVRAPYCQTFEAEALGSTVKYMGREGVPRIDVHAYDLEDEPSFPGDFLERGRIPALLDAISMLKERVGDEVAVAGGIIGPFSIVANLVGITEVLKASFKKPEKVEPFLAVAEQAGTTLAKALMDRGADFICIEDMMASIDVISPDIFRKLAQPYEKRQIESLEGITTVIHICGKLDPIVPDVADTGTTGISVEPTVDIAKAQQLLGGYDHFIPLIGGVDAVTTLFSGTPESVHEEATQALNEGYNIIAPGCSIPPSAETEVLRAMVRAAEEWAA